MEIKPIKRLYGEIALPGDKSISHRAIMAGAISAGRTEVKGVLDCEDCNYTTRALRSMGVDIKTNGDKTIILGKGLRGLRQSSDSINVGNSGTTMRLLAGIAAGQNFETTLIGDSSLSARPMKRIVEPLSRMGIYIKANKGEYPPLVIKGGEIKPIRYKMPLASAQVKSAILFAALYADGITCVEEPFKSRDHTERMLKFFGAKLRVEDLKVFLQGPSNLTGRTVEIPSDISSASFFMAGAALLKNSWIRMNKVSINPTRAGILKVLTLMGAKPKIVNENDAFEPYGDIVMESCRTKGVILGKDVIPSIIDELPIIFVLASLSKGRTVIKGARELRVKETDRVNSMKENLQKMGAKFEVSGSDIIIHGVDKLKGSDLKSYGDHRTCMAMAIAALAAKGESVIDDVSCVTKSFPEFFGVLENLKR